MAVSSPATMASVVAEFGGTTPHNLSEYVRGGAYVPNGPSQNANISTTAAGLNLSQFAGAVAAYIVNPLSFNGGTYSDPDGGPTSSSRLEMYADGTWAILYNGVTQFSGNWRVPTQAGIGSSYYVRFTLNSTSGAASQTTWTLTPATSGSTTPTLISTTQSCQVTASATTVSRTRTANFTVAVATDSGMTNIVSSSSLTLTASAVPA